MARLYFEEIQVGCEIPPLVKNPTTTQLVKWAGATQDPARIHYDKDRAQAVKLAGPIVHGLLKCQWFIQMLTDWIGNDSDVRRISCQYRGIDLPGDVITCRGNVTRTYLEEGQGHVECELWLGNQRDETTTLATAIVALPTRECADASA